MTAPTKGHRRSPKSPFVDSADDPNSIPTAGDNTAGLEYAHADKRMNQHTMAAASMEVEPVAPEPRAARLEGTPRGVSVEVMERYEKFRAKAASARGQSPARPASKPAAETVRYTQVPEFMGSPPVTAYVTKSPAEEFLASRTRVTIELQDGIFTLPAVSVRQSAYAIVILVPLSDDRSIFVPRPGTELTLTHGDDRLHAYFPGAYVEYQELGVAVMAFIKVDKHD